MVAAVVAGGEPPATQPGAAFSSSAPTTSETTAGTTTGTTRIDTIVPTTGRTPGTTTTTTAKPPPPPPADEGFAWLPWGPADPGDPPPIQWYGRFQAGECVEDRTREAPLWKAVAALCAVVAEGDVSQWANVRVAPAPGQVPCLESAVLALLERAVAWHERNPGRRPAVAFAQRGQATACPLVVEGVAGPDPDDGCERVSPLRGPVAGETGLTFCGSGFDSGDLTVLVGGKAATLNYATTTQVAVSTPEADGPGTVRLEVVSSGRRVVVAESFEYEAEAGPAS